ncbi:sugar phosphate isomerase/epimerase [Reichenbachiella agarivorans]|uniref:Sugar phosphate isomerase/epimerase n=1 Tax=Reichenbachiella agarivorans TaxID=2979464 RepID=A0ABY6CQ88_9BACT|nr:sugar phosphate isomerase/epimerase family protein [Reichenbachiella agarivorans]UXP32686.1 sugar phosphate isomerase/epimerase [Reichenbachiella agarivorans]
MMKSLLLYMSIVSIIWINTGCTLTKSEEKQQPDVKISLAEWSLHRAIKSGKMDNLDFPRVAAQEFGIYAVEYVSQLFPDNNYDAAYLQQLKDSCERYHVKSTMIMVDHEGNLGDTTEVARQIAVQNHVKWLEAAEFLGCLSIRVNGNGFGTDEDVSAALVKSMRELGDLAKEKGLMVIIENHGVSMPDGSWNMNSFSSNGTRLSQVLAIANHPNVGALPDFGNFADYDKYQGVKDLLPYSFGISAKTFRFDENGEAVETDYKRIFDMVNASNFDGYIGVEFEGDGVSEHEGIKMTKALIEKYWDRIPKEQ